MGGSVYPWLCLISNSRTDLIKIAPEIEQVKDVFTT